MDINKVYKVCVTCEFWSNIVESMEKKHKNHPIASILIISISRYPLSLSAKDSNLASGDTVVVPF